MRKLLQKITFCGRTMAVGEKCDHVHETPPTAKMCRVSHYFRLCFAPKPDTPTPPRGTILHLFAFLYA
jgi:hypothetical protein